MTTNNSDTSIQMPPPLTLREYSAGAQSTALYDPAHGLDYCVHGLTSEAGEVAGVVKRRYRGDHEGINQEALLKELGDTLWYVSEAARCGGSSLEAVARMNLDKLAKRKAAGTIIGKGDNR